MPPHKKKEREKHMKIHLLIDHTALLVDDKKPTVTVEPDCAGTLEIEGVCFPVETGSGLKRMPEMIGNVRVVFISRSGVRYKAIKTRMKDGVPYSAVDYVSEYMQMRIKIDQMERRMDRMAEEFHKISAEQKRDALGFLTKNTKHTEVT